MNSIDTFRLISVNIRRIIPGIREEDINRESMCAPIGLDSIGRAELIEMTLEDLGLSVSRFEFHIAHNLGELSDLFARELQKKNPSDCLPVAAKLQND